MKSVAKRRTKSQKARLAKTHGPDGRILAPAHFTPEDRAELAAKVQKRVAPPAGHPLHEDPYGYVDEGHRRIAKALIALEEIQREHIPWLAQARDLANITGSGPLSRMAFELNYRWVTDKIGEALSGCIGALADLGGLEDDIRRRRVAGGAS